MTRNHNPSPHIIKDSLKRLGLKDPDRADSCRQDCLDAISRAGRVLAVLADLHIATAERRCEKRRIYDKLSSVANNLKAAETVLTEGIRGIVKSIDKQPLPHPEFQPIGRNFREPTAPLPPRPAFKSTRGTRQPVKARSQPASKSLKPGSKTVVRKGREQPATHKPAKAKSAQPEAQSADTADVAKAC